MMAKTPPGADDVRPKASPSQTRFCQPVFPRKESFLQREHQVCQTTDAFEDRVVLSCKSESAIDLESDDVGFNKLEHWHVQLCLVKCSDVNLTNLNLDSSNIGDKGAVQLGNALLYNHSVKELRLAKSGITAMGVAHLCQCLNQNKANCVEQLSLAHNSIGDKGVESISNYIGCLPGQGSLKSLWLTSTGLGDVGALALALAFRRNPIVELYLQDNHIGPQGAIELAAWLSTDTILQVLNLHKNCIENDGVVALIKDGLILNDLSALKKCVLSANNVSNDAAVAIGAYLGWNPTLQILDLSMNNIGDVGLQFMAMGLTLNFRLSSLKLGYNPIADSGVVALAKCLQVNWSLVSLCLKGNDFITETGVHALVSCLMKNRSILTIVGITEIVDDANMLQILQSLLKRNRDSVARR